MTDRAEHAAAIAEFNEKAALRHIAAQDAEIVQLRARVAQMEGLCRAASRLSREVLTLRARVAKLEAALREARGWVQDDVNLDHRHRGQDVLDRIDAALSEDAPQ